MAEYVNSTFVNGKRIFIRERFEPAAIGHLMRGHVDEAKIAATAAFYRDTVGQFKDATVSMRFTDVGPHYVVQMDFDASRDRRFVRTAQMEQALQYFARFFGAEIPGENGENIGPPAVNLGCRVTFPGMAIRLAASLVANFVDFVFGHFTSCLAAIAGVVFGRQQNYPPAWHGLDHAQALFEAHPELRDVGPQPLPMPRLID